MTLNLKYSYLFNFYFPALIITVILQKIYCSTIGVEYMHINKMDQSEWIRKRFETPDVMKLTNEEKRTLMARLIRSQR